jgi:hypothetical protein
MTIEFEQPKTKKSEARVKLANVALGGSHIVLSERKEFCIPSGTMVELPEADLHKIAQTDNVDDIIRYAHAVILPSDTRIEVGLEEDGPIVYVEDPALSHLLNVFARAHEGALELVSTDPYDSAKITISGRGFTGDSFSLENVSFTSAVLWVNCRP